MREHVPQTGVGKALLPGPRVTERTGNHPRTGTSSSEKRGFPGSTRLSRDSRGAARRGGAASVPPHPRGDSRPRLPPPSPGAEPAGRVGEKGTEGWSPAPRHQGSPRPHPRGRAAAGAALSALPTAMRGAPGRDAGRQRRRCPRARGTHLRAVRGFSPQCVSLPIGNGTRMRDNLPRGGESAGRLSTKGWTWVWSFLCEKEFKIMN